MRRSHNNFIGPILLATLALAGCGTSSPPATKLQGTGNVPKISFKSAAIKASANRGPEIPARYTCDGENVSPPLEWGAVPPHTGQLILFVLGATPLPGKSSYTISVEWAMAGIDPALHHLAAGQVPQGANVGLNPNNTHRYSICPERGQLEQYAFELYGLPEGATIPVNFKDIRALTELVANRRKSPAIAHGTFGAFYKRS
jgi:phosphatidylethanolamine-binding protein (PEBP) family uncharacterized protein